MNETQLITFMRRIPEEVVLSGTYMCNYYSTNGDSQLLRDVAYICGILWEVLALCLAVWVGVQHSREMERPWTLWNTVDCIIVLIKTHARYFIAWVHKLDASVTFRWTLIIVLLSFLASASALCLQHWYVKIWPTSAFDWVLFFQNSTSVGNQAYRSILQISLLMQMFVLGPRLILSIREYHATLVTNSQSTTDMTTIVFQERTHVTVSSNV